MSKFKVQSSKIWQLGFVILISLFVLLSADSVSAGSMSLSRSSFAITGEPGVVTTETLAVNNISPAAQSYQFNSSGLDDKMVSILPRQFWLPPGGEQTVVLRFRAGQDIKDAHIDLLSYDSNQTSNFKIAQGIKLPVHFFVPVVAGAQTSAQRPGMPLGARIWVVLVYMVDLSLFFIVFWLYYLCRQKNNFL